MTVLDILVHFTSSGVNISSTLFKNCEQTVLYRDIKICTYVGQPSAKSVWKMCSRHNILEEQKNKTLTCLTSSKLSGVILKL